MKIITGYKTTILHALLVIGLISGYGISASVSASDEASKPEAHSDGVATTISDAAITAQVKAKISGESQLDDSNISVTTTNGIVTLGGMASSSKAKSAAKVIATSIDGVKSVDNNLATPDSISAVSKSNEIASDSWITTKVKSELLTDSLSKGVDVNVNTTDGVVVLKGALVDQYAIDHVKHIAGKVKGVKGVDVSELTVIKQ